MCIVNYSYDCESPEFITVTTPTARKEHRCCECRGPIKPGEKYENAAGKWDGEFQTFKTCLTCETIRDEYCCGVPYGALWEAMRETFFEREDYNETDWLTGR